MEYPMPRTIDTRVYVRGAKGALVPIPGVYMDENGAEVSDLRCDCCNASLMVKVVLPSGRVLGRSCYKTERCMVAPRRRMFVCRTIRRGAYTIDHVRVSDGVGFGWFTKGGKSVDGRVPAVSMRDAIKHWKSLAEATP